jgi:hypothetical protein
MRTKFLCFSLSLLVLFSSLALAAESGDTRQADPQQMRLRPGWTTLRVDTLAFSSSDLLEKAIRLGASGDRDAWYTFKNQTLLMNQCIMLKAATPVFLIGMPGPNQAKIRLREQPETWYTIGASIN